MLTICIPTRNRSTLLEKLISSVINQTFKEFKLIVLDNNSEDGTETVIKNFQDNRISYYKSDVSLSLSQNLNRSFKFLDSKYILILHDDDILDTRFLEKNISYLENDINLSLVASSMSIIDINGNLLPDEQIIENDIYFNQYEYWDAYYNKGIFLPMPTVIFRTSVLRRYNLRYCDDVGPNLDQYFWFELNLIKEVRFLLRKEKLYFYRRHEGQNTDWNYQSFLLDRKAYLLALKNNLSGIISIIDNKKSSQLDFLISRCFLSKSNLVFKEKLSDYYFDRAKKSIRQRILLFFFKKDFLFLSLLYLRNIKSIIHKL